MFYPYEFLLHQCGLKIGLFYLQWHTTALNRTVLCLGNASGAGTPTSRGRIGGFRHLLTRSYYSLGVLITLILFPLVILLFLDTIFTGLTTSLNGDNLNQNAGSEKSTSSRPAQMEILLPGVTLPLNEIGYYLVTMIFATIVHELGHALAALAEDVPVTGFGFYVGNSFFSSIPSFQLFRRIFPMCLLL